MTVAMPAAISNLALEQLALERGASVAQWPHEALLSTTESRESHERVRTCLGRSAVDFFMPGTQPWSPESRGTSALPRFGCLWDHIDFVYSRASRTRASSSDKPLNCRK